MNTTPITRSLLIALFIAQSLFSIGCAHKDRLHEFEWLPRTCAYHLRLNMQPLPEWHPLRSGDDKSVHSAGVSVLGKSVKFKEAGPIEHHIVDWK